MRELAAALRRGSWQVTVSLVPTKDSMELVKVLPASEVQVSLGLAVDLGTTSIVVYVVDMEDGKILSAASGHNRQASCGDDVINRMVCAEKQGVEKSFCPGVFSGQFVRACAWTMGSSSCVKLVDQPVEFF